MTAPKFTIEASYKTGKTVKHPGLVRFQAIAGIYAFVDELMADPNKKGVTRVTIEIEEENEYQPATQNGKWTEGNST